jgi:hypothetical protein
VTDKDKGNDTDRYVVPNSERGGWDVVKEDHKRASVHTENKPEAVASAKQIVTNEGGGVVRVQDKEGKFQEGKEIKGPKQP